MQNILEIYDENLHVKESITWKKQRESISFSLRDSKGNQVARATMPIKDLKEYILANNKMKE